jgi:hypothetical protein
VDAAAHVFQSMNAMVFKPFNTDAIKINYEGIGKIVSFFFSCHFHVFCDGFFCFYGK